MKRFQFLLVDAGPIIKLFQLGIWDEFIARCDVTVSRIVAEEAQYAKGCDEDVYINLESYEAQGHIKIIDVELSQVRNFHQQFDFQYKTHVVFYLS